MRDQMTRATRLLDRATSLSSSFSSQKKKKGLIAGVAAGGCFIFLAIYAAVVTGLAFWTDRSMDWICTQIADKPVDVHLGWSFLISLLAPFTFVGNVIVEIIRACV